MSAAKKLISFKIISDVQCPWTVINLARVKEAMELNQDKFDFQFYFSPLILNQENIPKQGLNFVDYFLTQGMEGFDLEKLKMIFGFLNQVGDACKYKVSYAEPTESMTMHNTTTAHRLNEYILSKYGKDKQVELYENLIRQYWTNRQDIYKAEILAEQASQFGYDKQEILDFLNNETSEPTEQQIIEQARNNLQKEGQVPFFVFENGQVFSGFDGVISVDDFTKIFNDISQSQQ